MFRTAVPSGRQAPRQVRARIIAPLQQHNQYRLAATPGTVKLLVRQDGVYRVTAEQLVAAGFPTGAALSGLQIWSGGRSVAFRPRSFDGETLQPGDSVEFYARAADTQFTDTGVLGQLGLGSAAFIGPAARPRRHLPPPRSPRRRVRERTLHPALGTPTPRAGLGPVLVARP
jgi:hypothetical protein